ncbi:triose-phosphate isomerase [Mycoplasma sp. Pen4]|uniref:triose-phosphate isomerase n=1 Tax=Mycoplasma sp. Pen4 TaxID=640330 RepID=UPI001654BF08|nr:triose-phosphate isomerase [Mycoplasma sp. Pen4]QNM93509.1 triose-phosphate isomerase [Mycoplasma sp. Pen4]
MQNRKLVIGNWKMNKNLSETVAFLEEFKTKLESKKTNIASNVDFGIAAPFISLAAFKDLIDIPNFYLCAQNVSFYEKGAFTGEVSADMLKDLDVKYVIVGHNERRRYYGENCKIINTKAKLAIEAGLTPIICVGETYEAYESGQSKNVIYNQVMDSTQGIDLNKVIIAYEPIWATGTGYCSSAEWAQDICKYIHELVGKDVLIQYGGSVTSSNVKKLAAQPDIDGFLIGKASLKVEDFIKIIEEF